MAGAAEVVLAGIPGLDIAVLGVELAKFYFKSTEPVASKKAAELVKAGIQPNIQKDPTRPQESVDVTVDGVTIKVPKINYWDPALQWHDVKEYNGKQIYCDPNKVWDWLKLSDFITTEVSQTGGWKGMGWVSRYDDDAVLVDLVDRGVPMEMVGAVVGRKEGEVENAYRAAVTNNQARFTEAKRARADADKRESLRKALA